MSRLAFISTMCGYDPSVPRWAGCEELWGQTALRLALEGNEIGVNVFRWPERVEQIDQLEQAGCTVKRRKTIRGLSRLGRWIPAALHTRWINRFRPELAVITQHQFHTDGEWARRCRVSGMKYVLVIQAVDEAVHLREQDRLRLRPNYRAAEMCYFVSERNREVVQARLGLRLPKSKIARNPFKVPYDDPPPYPSSDSGFSFACVGRLDLAKGQDLLLSVLSMDKWRQRSVGVNFHGEGPRKQSLHAQVEALALNKISFRGFTPNVRAIWAENHALILASRSEGLPLALVEAMLCDRIAIVTDVGGNSELMIDNETGFLAESATAEKLDDALERAWARRGAWRKMGEAAGALTRTRVPEDPVVKFAREVSDLVNR